ncbi:MAG: N-acetyl-gamma-glutamyl-phosphate reductase [Phycisphaerae bacterium]
MNERIHIAILGGTGYGAGELLRLLSQHPRAVVASVTTTSQAGEPVTSAHPHLRGFFEIKMTANIDWPRLLDAERAIIFSALPHAASGVGLQRVLSEMPTSAKPSTLHMIDLSGDLRLQSHASHARHYPDSPLLPDFRTQFVYGLPEVNRSAILAARHIANPGCLASASILAAAPLVSDGFAGVVAVDAKTGSSGSGKQLKETTHHPTRHADFRAYKPLSHQHEGEILQAWGDADGGCVTLSFVAQSMDVSRGIFVSVHLTLPQETDTATVRQKYADFYKDSPFVRIVKDSPTLQDVVGSNFCDIAVVARGRQVIAMATIDNLVKGMAGTAIQNMNLMCNLPEQTGLWTPSLRPV